MDQPPAGPPDMAAMQRLFRKFDLEVLEGH
jgi:hypothetical protein